MTAKSTVLPPDVDALLQRHQGVLMRTDAIEAGMYDARLRQLARAGVLVRVARGGYVSAQTLAEADSWAAISLRGRAFVLSRPGGFLAGHAAAALLDLRTLGDADPLPTVVVHRRERVAGRRTPYGTIRGVSFPEAHRRLAGARFRAMSPAWTTVDLARRAKMDEALVMADGVLREHTRVSSQDGTDPGLVRAYDLGDALESVVGHRGWRRAAWAVDQADAGSESVLETCGRFAFLTAGLPHSVSNAHVRLADGRWRRVDHLWPWHYVVAEGDGAIKYDNRADASRIVADEKEREWDLRQLGLTVGRYTWRLARFDGAELGARISGLLAANPPRADPFPWWKEVPGIGRVPAAPEDQPTPWPSPVVLPASPAW